VMHGPPGARVSQVQVAETRQARGGTGFTIR
jgi:hypothetical protein